MKNSAKPIIILIITFFFTLTNFAQSESDVVAMLNGDEKKGNVTAISDEEITFIYNGETLEYKLKSKDVNKNYVCQR
ncbi:MAG: hypothetical protein CMC55_08115 [Flavobacteriaceae bacterium]|uniref:hypothetical protein n=1 Tax=Bizionia echini TaxID=649333 RepID=UPI000C93C523|nr:hypothetical protein [Flavobacteriaceae bacterium]|tara:strand:- start:194 stop:424 length:231 start_codon:yes stop_codon:yes gene_type:complete